MPRSTVRLPITAIILGVTLICLAGAGFATVRRTDQIGRDAAMAHLREAAHRAAAQTAAGLTTYTTLAAAVAATAAARTAVGLDPYALTPNPFDDQAQALFAADPRIGGIYLTTPSGTLLRGGEVLHDSTYGPATVLPPIPDTLLSRAAGTTPAVALGSPRDAAGSASDLWIGVPVRDRSTVRGLILLRVDASAVIAGVAGSTGDNGIQLLAGGRTYGGQGSPADGPSIVATVPDTPGWQIIAHQSDAVVDQSGQAARSSALIAGAMILAILLLTVWVTLTRIVTRPLGRVRGAIDAIAGGEMDTPLPDGPAEIGALAGGISTMRQHLQHHARGVMARNEALTAQVQQFTQALEPIAAGQLYRRVPLFDDPDSPLLDAVEATNHLIRRFRRLVADLKTAVHDVLHSSSLIHSRIIDAAAEAGRQQDQLEHQRQLVAAMSTQAEAAGQAARDTAAAAERVEQGVVGGSIALADVTASGDDIRRRTLENTGRINGLQDTAITLAGLVDRVQDMATSLGLLAYNGMLSAERQAQHGSGTAATTAFARMADEAQALAASFDRTLQEIRVAVDSAGRDIRAAILSHEAVAQDVLAAQQARDSLTAVFAGLAETVAQLRDAAANARAKATEQARLAAQVRDGNDQVAQVYERIRLNLDGAAEDITQRAGDLDRLAGSMADLQVDGPAALNQQTGPLTAA